MLQHYQNVCPVLGLTASLEGRVPPGTARLPQKTHHGPPCTRPTRQRGHHKGRSVAGLDTAQSVLWVNGMRSELRPRGPWVVGEGNQLKYHNDRILTQHLAKCAPCSAQGSRCAVQGTQRMSRPPLSKNCCLSGFFGHCSGAPGYVQSAYHHHRGLGVSEAKPVPRQLHSPGDGHLD